MKLSTINGYVPFYKRAQLTDDLHELARFRTDCEFMTKATMRAIIKNSKTIKQE